MAQFTIFVTSRIHRWRQNGMSNTTTPGTSCPICWHIYIYLDGVINFLLSLNAKELKIYNVIIISVLQKTHRKTKRKRNWESKRKNLDGIWSSWWNESWERLMVVTDVSTSWAEVIFPVKRMKCYTTGFKPFSTWREKKIEHRRNVLAHVANKQIFEIDGS